MVFIRNDADIAPTIKYFRLLRQQQYNKYSCLITAIITFNFFITQSFPSLSISLSYYYTSISYSFLIVPIFSNDVFFACSFFIVYQSKDEDDFLFSYPIPSNQKSFINKAVNVGLSEIRDELRIR